VSSIGSRPLDPERHRRAQTLFEQAEALPLEKRETLLETIGADDPVLSREVARLLEAAASMAEDFLEPSPTSRATRTRVGETLAHYRILEELGVGGMGEVYLAEDERLKRRLALKVLPPDLAGSPERLERFQREAETVAALNHPNIVTIYSIESEGEVHFLTMELVEGPTLRRLIDHSGALPIEDVLNFGVQISEGLAEAHAAGITHRDLKPGNVMVASNDRVKLLDFGLARADQPFGANAVLADKKDEITKEGAILGTIAYMSPEQAKGQPADRRSDLWAFGVVLWEMLTGRRPFGGGSVTETLAEVLKSDPPWGELPAGLPRPLLRLLRRCLERDPRRRLRDAGDARLEMLAALETPAETEALEAAQGPASRMLIAVAAAAAALAGLGVGWWLATSRAPGGASDSRARIVSITQLTDQPGWQRSPELSPDGSHLLYVSSDGGDDDIFLLRVGGENAINLTADSPEDDFDPAYSPDGSSIVFTSQRQGGGIFVMGATGESPRRVAGLGRNPEFSPDGKRILYAGDSRFKYMPLRVVGLDGSDDRVLGEEDAVAGVWSPSGRRIAFWGHPAGGIWTVPADGGDARPVTNDPATDWAPFWSADGHWLYFLSDRGGSWDLWRVPIDEASGETLGELQPVTAGMARYEEAAIADRGDLVALTAVRRRGEIVRVGFDPEAERVTSAPETIFESSNPIQGASVSPDGRWLASGTISPQDAILVVAVDGSQRRTVLADGHRYWAPHWSPDGRWIAFRSNRSGNYDLWAVRSDGSELKQLTDTSPTFLERPIFVDGGRRVCSSARDAEGIRGVCFELGPEGIDGVAAPLGAAELDELPGSRGFSPWSSLPDGRYLGGQVFGGAGNALAAYSFEDVEVRLARDVDDRPLEGFFFSTWIDGTRMIFWDRETAAARIWDVETGEIRTVEGVPGPGSGRNAMVVVSPDGRTLFVEKLLIESDIWLLRLAEEGRIGRGLR
jgi:eukaryotic-like serine/threonine-protein kinase